MNISLLDQERPVPLAARMRPVTLEEFIGQSHIIGEGKLLWRAIKADKLGSLIFYGPPGTGKTTLARIIAGATQAEFTQLNATTAGVKDIKATVERARYQRTILFIDEIHRFNKAQQDTLLPHVENGTVTFIGATTENPYFEVNKSLISRSTIFRLEPLTKDDILAVLERAVTDNRRGLGHYNLAITEEALEFLADKAGGDGRRALNALELAALTTAPDANGQIHIDLAAAQNCIQERAIIYDKDGDSHYDTISAFIKSMRGSDPDAAVYYLARMLAAGEDPKFIARRIVICASEDVGNADPHALMTATAAFTAVDLIGMPEARIILAQAAIYVACAPKSNASYLAIDNALADVENIPIKGIPIHLRDSSYKSAKEFGHGAGYKYAHDFPGNYVAQQYLPDELVGKVYYRPTGSGVEKRIGERLTKKGLYPC